MTYVTPISPAGEVWKANFWFDSITAELRAWTGRSDHWMQIRSELTIAVNEALTAEKIAMK